jgi:hypothetical protein
VRTCVSLKKKLRRVPEGITVTRAAAPSHRRRTKHKSLTQGNRNRTEMATDRTSRPKLARNLGTKLQAVNEHRTKTYATKAANELPNPQLQTSRRRLPPAVPPNQDETAHSCTATTRRSVPTYTARNLRNRPAATLVYSADGSSTGPGAEMSSGSKGYLSSERLVEGAALGVGREAKGAGDGCGGWPCRGRHAGRALQRSVVRLRGGQRTDSHGTGREARSGRRRWRGWGGLEAKIKEE